MQLTRHCPQCGFSSETDNNFCRNCGLQIDDRAHERLETERGKSQRIALFATVMLALWLLGLAWHYHAF